MNCWIRMSKETVLICLLLVIECQAQLDGPDLDLSDRVAQFRSILNIILTVDDLSQIPSNSSEGMAIASFAGGLQGLLNVGDGSPSGAPTASNSTCQTCRIGIGYIISEIRSGLSLDQLTLQVTTFCAKLGIARQEVCAGLIELNGPSIYYILSSAHLTTTMFCGIVFEPAGCKTPDFFSDWTVNLPPATTTSWLGFTSWPSKFARPLKILHLADIHLEPDYAIGSNAVCGDYLCCRLNDNSGMIPRQNVAGYYGDYRNCDLPGWSFKDALTHISMQHPDIDLIYLTGDHVPHNIWSTNTPSNQRIIRKVTHLIDSYFPNIQVIPVIGNHEVNPANLFSPRYVPKELSTNGMYQWLSQEYSRWIPHDAKRSFSYGGFYAIQFSPNLKIIVLNTNACYIYNFWQVYDHQDPGGQLEWLVNELLEAEYFGWKVHILGHVPPGLGECWSAWSRNFYAIITRFSATVTSQFYGHTHFDEFQLYYDESNPDQPINSIFVGGSLTPYPELNPGYRVYTVEPVNLGVTALQGWVYNLTMANALSPALPHWFKLYDTTKLFSNASPNSLNAFIYKLATDRNIFNLYYTNFFKGRRENPDICDNDCRKAYICRIVTPYYGVSSVCNKFSAIVDANSG